MTRIRGHHPARRDITGRLAVACSSIVLAAVLLPAVPGVGAGDGGTATTLLQRSRKAASANEFQGTLVVTWRDDGRLKERDVSVRVANGVLHMGDNRVVSAGSRRMLKTATGWRLLWSGASKGSTPDPTRKYRFDVQRETTVAGRVAKSVAITRAGEREMRERLFFDDVSGLLLRRDQFDDDGRLVRRVAFTEISEPEPAAKGEARDLPDASRKEGHSGPWALKYVPEELTAPKRIGDGFVLLGMYGQPGGSTQLYYSDGLVGLSVFESSGDLAWDELPDGGRYVSLGDVKALVYQTAAGSAVVWEHDDVTYTCVTDAPMDEVEKVATDFEHWDESSTLEDIGRFVTGPFSWG